MKVFSLAFKNLHDLYMASSWNSESFLFIIYKSTKKQGSRNKLSPFWWKYNVCQFDCILSLFLIKMLHFFLACDCKFSYCNFEKINFYWLYNCQFLITHWLYCKETWKPWKFKTSLIFDKLFTKWSLFFEVYKWSVRLELVHTIILKFWAIISLFKIRAAAEPVL